VGNVQLIKHRLTSLTGSSMGGTGTGQGPCDDMMHHWFNTLNLTITPHHHQPSSYGPGYDIMSGPAPPADSQEAPGGEPPAAAAAAAVQRQ
jgi:hypothetical protein